MIDGRPPAIRSAAFLPHFRSLAPMNAALLVAARRVPPQIRGIFSGFYDEHGAIPGQEFAQDGNAHEKGELGVITRRGFQNPQAGRRLNFTDGGADISREQILVGSVPARAFADFIVNSVAALGSKIMKRGKFMTTPNRKPVGPA